MAIQKSTDKDFEKIISSETPTIIKFEADWVFTLQESNRYS